MSSIHVKALRYQWAVLLFVGVPSVWAIGWWLVYDLLSLGDPLRRWLAPLLVVWLAPLLLGVFFLPVRRLGRPTLSLVWGFALVATSVSAALFTFFFNVPVHWLTYHIVWAPASTIVVVWFARRASAISFRHMLLLVGLWTAITWTGQLLYPPSTRVSGFGWSFSWPGMGWALLSDWIEYSIYVAYVLTAIWALSHADSVKRVPKRAIVFLFGTLIATRVVAQEITGIMYGLAFAEPSTDLGDVLLGWHHLWDVYWIVWHGAVILIVYRYEFVRTKLLGWAASVLHFWLHGIEKSDERPADSQRDVRRR